jgi:hypothetical protein
MVNDVIRLRAAVFERTGIALDEKDPIMAVLAVSAEQTEEIGARLLRRTSPMRVGLMCAGLAVAAAAGSSWATWQVAESQSRTERAEWLRQQNDPRTAALLRSAEGRAALRLAELGVAGVLARCSGRPSWRLVGDYCVPTTADGRPDGFKVTAR